MTAATTWLFVPGDRLDRFAKAAAAGADAVVIDLEDAVAPEHKVAARTSAVEWLEAGGRAWIRINAHGSAWYDDDVAAITGATGLLGVMVPKAEDAVHLAHLGERLPTGRGIVALVETARGIYNAFDVAAAARVERLAFGSIDFAVDIDAAESDDALLHARSTLVLASRVAGLAAPVDGVTVATRDTDAVATAAQNARRLGFGGKLCIHPAQLEPAAAAFLPTAAEIAWAQGILAVSTQESGAVRVDGQMVDAPVVARAQRIVERVRVPQEEMQ